MNKKDVKLGYVYLLTNPAMPGLVKIGMTEREDLEMRLKELYSTGVPLPFQCEFAAKVSQSDCHRIEKALHTAFAPDRVNENREFFRINTAQAKAILELFHHEDATEEVRDEINNDLSIEDKEAVNKNKPHRPPLNFHLMGIPNGSILQWVEDPSITVEVISERNVRYQGNEWYISRLTSQLKSWKNPHTAPGNFWTYKDRLLNDIYNETYPIIEEE